jgi:hypothetical protein
LQAFVRACNNKSILIIAPHGVAEQSMEPESRAVDKGFLLDVTLCDPLQGLPPPMNPMVAIATWTTCGPGRGRGSWSSGSCSSGRQMALLPTRTPAHTPTRTPRLENADGSQPAIQYEAQQPNSSQTAATLGLWPSFAPFASFPILCHVAGSAAATEQ